MIILRHGSQREFSFQGWKNGNPFIEHTLGKGFSNETQGGFMYLAVAVETKQHPKHLQDYRVWYLEVNGAGQVVGVGVKTKTELIESLFQSVRKTGQSNWRAFCKDAEKSHPIEVADFICMNMHENTHFGNLPTLHEFQSVLDALSAQLEIRSIA
jgi:hypothetical protein